MSLCNHAKKKKFKNYYEGFVLNKPNYKRNLNILVTMDIQDDSESLNSEQSFYIVKNFIYI